MTEPKKLHFINYTVLRKHLFNANGFHAPSFPSTSGNHNAK
ncbi:hypothetical protein D917_01330 [Trichinella nativa]|uniref:Uncharacterized protein n=1 Tax=Trichinella nativa TaxID=6335 RepID=A0A1Y3ERZ2_9BILA|nr:hypothetical protein D917_01330 [Trichinella nativa]